MVSKILYMVLACIAFMFASAKTQGFYGTPVVSYKKTIVVSNSGGGNFSTIQSAIDSVPRNSKDWIRIYVKAGVYREQVYIPMDKPHIFFHGEGRKKTYVVSDVHESISTSAVFFSQADNIVVKSITFQNYYNNPPNGNRISTAVAARIEGDKSAFYGCRFIGFQDTLWDCHGRHYFRRCTIQGAIDFIFGSGQSIYEKCTISVIAGSLNGLAGFITAQGRLSPKEINGFVFKECNVIGTGITYLGRPWRPYATVIFYNSSLSGVVHPKGWSPWGNNRSELMVTYAEHNCYGSGSNTSKRVKWETSLSEDMFRWFTSMSYIDGEGWIENQPFNMLN